MRRKDAQALVEAGRKSANGVRAVLERCAARLRDTVSEVGTLTTVMRHVGARESIAHLDDLVLALVMLSIDSVRELAALTSTTQREALDILARRLQEHLEEFQAMRRREPPRMPISG